MHIRIALLIGIITLSIGSSAFACGGSCYNTHRVYRPVVNAPVHFSYGYRAQVPNRARLAKPAPGQLPAVPSSRVAVPTTPAPVPTTSAAPAVPTPAAKPAPAATPVEKKSDTSDNPFSKLSNLELIELTGVRQIIEGRN